MTVAHTPGPWHVYQHFATPRPDRCEVVGATRDDDVAENLTLDNAEFVVRACNSHYELLEALKGIAEFGKRHPGHGFSCATLAEQAIAKAEGR